MGWAYLALCKPVETARGEDQKEILVLLYLFRVYVKRRRLPDCPHLHGSLHLDSGREAAHPTDKQARPADRRGTGKKKKKRGDRCWRNEKSGSALQHIARVLQWPEKKKKYKAQKRKKRRKKKKKQHHQRSNNGTK